MDLHEIDLNLLVHLDALLAERHVTRASKRVGLSQSAMSRALGRLRELFDDDLLIKTSGGMDPTPLALKLAPRVRRVLDEITRAVEDSRPFDPATSTRAFSLVLDPLATVCAAPLLAALHEAAPGATFQVAPSRGQRLDLALLDARADLAVGALAAARPEVALVDLARLPFSLILAASHPRAVSDWSALELEAAARASLAPQDDPHTQSWTARWAPARAVAPDWGALCGLVARSALVAIAPTACALGEPRLVARELPITAPAASLRAAWRAEREDAGVDWLRAAVQDALTRTPGVETL
jgi:DNA-binding transcriptional LysR family regulator